MLLKNILDKEKPFVIFKKPNSGKIQIWQQKNAQLYTSGDLSENGFYFAPYDFAKHPVVVFPENQLKKQEVFIRDLKPHGVLGKESFALEISSSGKETYQQKVDETIQLIQSGILQKMVLSRAFKIKISYFEKFDALLNLLTTYEQSYIYLWYHPQVGTWMGATPELLAQYQQGYFQTIALAGTLPVKKKLPVIWSPKEINEQQLVTDYIVKKIKMFASTITISKPATIYQGHLAHIRTEISADMKDAAVNDLILNLHPTPAVCGLPVEQAKKYIERIENRDRKYYTGFLGEKSDDLTAFYVNLRSMEVLPDHLIVHVGGGIVADSQPEQEWQEILMKTKVLLSVLG